MAVTIRYQVILFAKSSGKDPRTLLREGHTDGLSLVFTLHCRALYK